MRKILGIWLVVFIPWFFYRLLFKLPEWTDELIVKPLVFILIPLKISKLKMLPGFEDKKNVFEDILIGVATGFVFAFTALLANRLKYGGFLFSQVLSFENGGVIFYLFLSLVTALSEEILGRGFFFGILVKNYGLTLSALFSSLLFLSLHLPILFLRLHLVLTTSIVFLVSIFLLSMVNSYLYYNRRSLVLAILVHAFWNMSVALYL